MTRSVFAIAVACAFAVGCPGERAADPTTSLKNHQVACTAKGEAIVGMDLFQGEPCTSTELRLEALVKTDPDCRAYFGDASVIGTLCEKDGGIDGGD